MSEQLRKQNIMLLLFTLGLILLSATLYYILVFSNRDYIEGNILNMSYIPQVDEGRILTPWKNQALHSTLLFRTLFLHKSDLSSFEKDMAESYEVLNDGLTYRITLKKDLVWSDGTIITLDDIIFSIHAVLKGRDVNGEYTAAFRAIDGADDFIEKGANSIVGLVKESNTLIIHMQEKYSRFLDVLAQFVILPKHILEHENLAELHLNKFWAKPVCSGMYILTGTVANSYFKLVPNTYSSLPKPQIDEIRLHYNSKRVNYDYYTTNNIAEMVNLSTLKNLRRYKVDMLFYRYFIVNIEGIDGRINPAMKDLRVRQAIAYAIDRPNLLYNLYFNTGNLIDSGIPRSNSLYNGFSYDYDVARARELLRESSYNTQRKLRIAYYYTDTTSLYFLKNISEQLGAIGFSVELIYARDGTEFLYNTRDYDIALKGLASFDSIVWYNEYTSSHPYFRNLYGGDTSFDHLIQVVSSESDKEKQDQAFTALQNLEQKELYKIPLFTLSQAVYIDESRVSVPKNISFGNTWYRYNVDFEKWYIKKE